MYYKYIYVFIELFIKIISKLIDITKFGWYTIYNEYK